ncbi:MAG TPA: hypothetical protein ENK64_02395 [Flavobacteriales bacterium]|nr:hypothetical protein [Flavobacteriales bacterium]
MKKLVLIIVIVLSSISFINATKNNIESKDKTQKTMYQDPYSACWHAAELAEDACCGYVGCSFETFDRVYSGCVAGIE